jgi:hypothetical protein
MYSPMGEKKKGHAMEASIERHCLGRKELSFCKGEAEGK